MNHPQIAIILRILFSISLLFITGWLGFAHRSPWVIPLLGISFTILYIGGKWHSWKFALINGGARAWAKALLSTLPTQCILAAVVYLIGLGLGRLLANQPLAGVVSKWDVLTISILTLSGLLVCFIITFLEKSEKPIHHAPEVIESKIDLRVQDDSNSPEKRDFDILADVITSDNLLSSFRSEVDYTREALYYFTDDQKNRSKYTPYAVSDTEIFEAEKRLGFKLPESLKRIYKIKNGGSIRDVRVAKVTHPRPIYEDWEYAFGGYEGLLRLEHLETLHESILNFHDEEDEEAFPDGSKEMLIVAHGHGVVTLLDYRNTNEPKVRVIDFNVENWEENHVCYENFDSFFAQIRKVDKAFGKVKEEKPITQYGPSLSNPDGFWIYKRSASYGVGDQLWNETEKRLKVELPMELKPYLEAANGGFPFFKILPHLEGDENQREALNPFPADGELLGIDHWITLEELSNRIKFTPHYKSWADSWKDSHKLIVISGKFDTVLMLDYRHNQKPEVIYVKDLNHQDQYHNLGNVQKFLKDLRAFQTPHFGESPIGDLQLSARSFRAEIFWHASERPGVSQEELKTHEERLGHEFPESLKIWMQKQNGGFARFRYMPPQAPNIYGYLNPSPMAKDWFDLFPDGILPIEQWQTLKNWLQNVTETLGESLRQQGHSQYVGADYGNPENIIVIAKGANRLTLLDKSRQSYVENAEIVQIVKKDDGWREEYRSYSIQNLELRARKSEF